MQHALHVEQGDRRRSWPLVSGSYEIDLAPVVAGTRLAVTANDSGFETRVLADQSWGDDLRLVAELRLPAVSSALWPTYQGLLERRKFDRAHVYEFRGPGWNAIQHDDRRLAIPAVIVQNGDLYHVVGADPGFSAHITANVDGDGSVIAVEWTYRHEAGCHDGLTRRFVVGTADSIERALDLWFELATPDVPAGPDWLHDIAWTNYDFMSKNGAGWFDDIDAFCNLCGADNRHRAAFTLHAWYDVVGRYCFDPVTKRLDDTWTVFPYMGDPRLRAREGEQQLGGTHPPGYAFRNLANYRPIPMDWNEVRRRIRYAKDRGLRVPFYLITGMMALGDRAKHVAAGDGLEPELGLWVGPDAVGETYRMNPLHDGVRDRILGLTRAVLDKVGDLIDALVIDEAYYIGYGQLGPATCAGYADLAQATLLKEIADLCHTHRRDIALLTADHMGTQFLEHQAYPYSLYADGIYHDAWCFGQTWDACRFPAWRNTVWSCNWAPSTAIKNTKWAVLAYDAPIATGNGCFGDDIGLGQMTETDRGLLHALFVTATTRRRTRRLTIVDAR